MTDPTLAHLFRALLQLPGTQRAGLVQAVQDLSEARASLQYVHAAPEPLCAQTLRDHLTARYAQRWGLTVPDTRAILEIVEGVGPPASPAPPGPPSPPAPWEALTTQRLQVLLQGGWTYARIAQELTEGGLTVGRGVIKQLSRGRHLHKASEALLTALQQLPEQLPDVQTPEASLLARYRAALADLGWADISELHRFLTRLPPDAARPVQDLLHRVGDSVLAARSAGAEAPGVQQRDLAELVTYLEGLSRARQLHSEFSRAETLGWTLPQLTVLLRQGGYNGPALQADRQNLTPRQVAEVTALLRELVQGPPPALSPEPGSSPAGVINRKAERVAFVNHILNEKGVVCSTDINTRFGMSGGAAMTFLRQTMRLQPCGQGQYRRVK